MNIKKIIIIVVCIILSIAAITVGCIMYKNRDSGESSKADLISVIFDNQYFQLEKGLDVKVCEYDDLMLDENGLAIQFDSPSRIDSSYKLEITSDNTLKSFISYYDQEKNVITEEDQNGKSILQYNGSKLHWIPNKDIVKDGYEEEINVEAYGEDEELVSKEIITIKISDNTVIATWHD